MGDTGRGIESIQQATNELPDRPPSVEAEESIATAQVVDSEEAIALETDAEEAAA